jgi:hypothetical protein
MMNTNINRGSRLAVLGLSLLLLVIAFLAGRATSSDPDARPEPVPAIGGESQEAEGDTDSPLAAATTFARVIAGPSGDAEDYLTDVSALAAPAWRERAAELATNTLGFIEERYGQGGQIVFHPLKHRVRDESEDEALVDIWGVVLASGPKLGGIEESWLTGTIHLLYVDGSWKVSEQTSVGGPTPELLRTEDGFSVSRILEEFEEFDDVPTS